MGFSFATCERNTALEFLKKIYKHEISDTSNSAGPLLDFVEKDIVRIQDPMMHVNANIIPGGNWSEEFRDEVVRSAKLFHKD